MAAERILNIEGDESVSYAIDDVATVDILSSIWMRFELILKRWILRYINVL
jgi:hypothetical protein